MNITRNVVLDLWPLYASGDASDDTRALVEQFMKDDPEFARALSQEARIPATAAAPPPDHELRTLHRVRKRVIGHHRLLLLAMIFSSMAFGRIISDTSWDVSPRNFIVVASMALAFWIAYCVTLLRMRARILIVPGPPKPPRRRA
jgi:hypothetical protein